MTKKKAPAKKKARASAPKPAELADRIARSLFVIDEAVANDAEHIQAVLHAAESSGNVEIINGTLVEPTDFEWFDDLLTKLSHDHPALGDRLHQIGVSALEHGDHQWREGYLIGLAVGRRMAGGAR